ncbi:MAG: dockerin type I repeat-containing protein [Ruminococcus sp.]|nr:dockerin type I repeat-containing protein [Ruminococcus sp.]
MKKTEKTALTAALFAAAMHVGTANSEPVDASAAFSGNTTTTVVGMENKESSQPAVLKDVITEFKSEMAGVYGPPPTTTVTNADEEDTPVTTTTEPILPGFTTVYGPPSMFTTTTPKDKDDVVTTTTIDKVIAELKNDGQPVYGPKPFYGDVNDDGSTDIYDMLLLREEFAKPNPKYSFQADVNGDFKVSVADLVLLNKYLLGQIDDIRNPEDDNEVVKTTMRTQPAYGPPVTYTTAADEEEDVVTTTMDEFQDVYGPPPSWYTTVADDEEDVVTTTMDEFQDVYGPPPSWYTTTVDDLDDPEVTTATTFAPLYGPPSVFQ